jgi:hypothetical protein
MLYVVFMKKGFNGMARARSRFSKNQGQCIEDTQRKFSVY